MDIPKQLIGDIEKLKVVGCWNREDKVFIKDNLEFIGKHATEQENNQIIEIIDILSKGRIAQDDKKRLIKSKQFMINMVNKYEENFNSEPNKDIIDINLSVEQVEKLLDDKIPKYNKFTENHPMEGVTFDKNIKKYKVQHKTINTNTKTINMACEKIKNFYEDKISDLIGNNILKKEFVYGEHYFLTYWHKNEPYFDIQHIISVLNLKKSSWNDKYNEYFEQIVYYMWHQNEFSGYILRELIDEETVYNLILSSNSVLSKKFKKEVAVILKQLRENGNLQIDNTGMKLKKSSKTKNMNEDHANKINTNYINALSYNSDLDMIYVTSLIINATTIPISYYMKKHVLYAVIIPLKTNHNNVIIKFGYTEDIIERMITLQQEYKSEIFFINAKIITGEKDEKHFHKMLKNAYPHLIENQTIDNKDKTELYKLSRKLIEEFDSYPNQDIPKEKHIKLTHGEKQIIDYIKTQEIYFLNYLNQSHTNNPAMENKIMDYWIIKENNHHAEIMKEKDLLFAEKDLQFIDKDTERIKQETERIKQETERLKQATEFEKAHGEINIRELELKLQIIKEQNKQPNQQAKQKNIVKL